LGVSRKENRHGVSHGDKTHQVNTVNRRQKENVKGKRKKTGGKERVVFRGKKKTEFAQEGQPKGSLRFKKTVGEKAKKLKPKGKEGEREVRGRLGEPPGAETHSKARDYARSVSVLPSCEKREPEKGRRKKKNIQRMPTKSLHRSRSQQKREGSPMNEKDTKKKKNER